DEFLNQIIGADFMGKISINNRIVGAGFFDGLEFSLDPQLYSVDSCDVIHPISPACACLRYDLTNIAGISHETGHPINGARLLYFAFPFEIVESCSMRAKVMESILSYLLIIDGVEDRKYESDVTQPEKMTLEQNYPNPFGPATSIRYHIPTAGHATVKIYNSIGQLVRTIEDKELAPGTYEAMWDGSNKSGIKVPTGIYFYTLTLDNLKLSSKKIVIVR
ncbi:MAG: T9SS type A sorting domain-containing protein, partial [bacterium]